MGLFVMNVSRLALLYRHICFLQPCDHLLGRLFCVWDVFLCFVTFSNGVSDQA